MITQEQLLYPSILSLLKIIDSFVQQLEAEGIKIEKDELEKKVRGVVINYSKQAWNDEKLPLYAFNSKWRSQEFERDLYLLFRRHITVSSRPKLSKSAEELLERYEKMGVFDDYFIGNIKKDIENVIAVLKRSKVNQK